MLNIIPLDLGLTTLTNGEPVLTLTRGVSHTDGERIGSYTAVIDLNMSEEFGMELAFSLGDWDEADPKTARIFVTLVLWVEPTYFHFEVTNAEYSVFGKMASLGKMLSRQEALAHPEIEEVLQLSNHILFHDHIVREYFRLGSLGPCPLCSFRGLGPGAKADPTTGKSSGKSPPAAKSRPRKKPSSAFGVPSSTRSGKRCLP